MKALFQELAGYNRWANARLYADAAALPEEALHRDIGVYFPSLFATLSHILNVDRAWIFLLQGGALGDMQLPALPDTFEDLRSARRVQDDLLLDWMASIDLAWLDAPFIFTSGLGAWAGLSCTGTRASTLMHVFNHQTHHRGQAHAALTRLGVAEPQALDMIVKGLLGQ